MRAGSIVTRADRLAAMVALGADLAEGDTLSSPRHRTPAAAQAATRPRACGSGAIDRGRPQRPRHQRRQHAAHAVGLGRLDRLDDQAERLQPFADRLQRRSAWLARARWRRARGRAAQMRSRASRAAASKIGNSAAGSANAPAPPNMATTGMPGRRVGRQRLAMAPAADAEQRVDTPLQEAPHQHVVTVGVAARGGDQQRVTGFLDRLAERVEQVDAQRVAAGLRRSGPSSWCGQLRSVRAASFGT